MNMPINSACSWILKNILKQRNVVQGLEEWHDVLQTKKFKMRKFYYVLLDQQQQVYWQRPRALFVLWLACQDRLAIKERLHWFDMLENGTCSFYEKTETIQHLMFECKDMAKECKYILEWLQLSHIPREWTHELNWVIHASKSKNPKECVCGDVGSIRMIRFMKIM